MTETHTNSGLDRVEFETQMADRVVAAAARMRRANRECAKIERECNDKAQLVRENKSWTFWNSERASAANEILLCKRAMREEGYAGSDKWLGDLIAETYRSSLRYAKEINLSERAERAANAIRAALGSLSGASGRGEGSRRQPLFGAVGEAMRAAYEGVDKRRLLCIYIDDDDLRGIDIPEAVALAPNIWAHFLTGSVH